jgi:hypothetical protein
MCEVANHGSALRPDKGHAPALIVGVGPRRGLIVEFELNNNPSPFANLRISLIPALFQKGST